VAVDIEEQDGYYVIKAPIAGVRLSDLDIEVEGCDVIIRGERRSSESSGSPLLQECFWGPFERRVSLPCQVDPKRVKATFNRECILRILVPKEREERVRIVRVGDLS
jgi:HSP20 family protein